MKKKESEWVHSPGIHSENILAASMSPALGDTSPSSQLAASWQRAVVETKMEDSEGTGEGPSIFPRFCPSLCHRCTAQHWCTEVSFSLVREVS